MRSHQTSSAPFRRWVRAIVAVVMVAGVALVAACAQEPASIKAGPSARVVASPADPARRGDCPTGSSATVEFVDVVYVGSQAFERGGVWGSVAPPGTRLGSTVESVRCTYADDSAPDADYHAQPGDASYLPVGTQVREVVGYEGFRVAARRGKELALYELRASPSARTGADLFPAVRRHVVGLVLSSQEDGKREVGRLTPPARLAPVVDQMFSAPYVPARASATWDVFLDLALDDGTRVQRAYDSEQGVLNPGLVLPPAIRDELRRALR